MNKKILVVPLVLSLLSVAIVAANPEWITSIPGVPIGYPWLNFKITKSGIHIASDPLFDPNNLPDFGDPEAVPLGWVNFVCASDNPKNLPNGFDFSVTGKGLTPGVTYTVVANALVGSFDEGSSYTLGSLTADGNGEGELSGYVDLPGPALPPDSPLYDWAITIELSGAVVLTSHFADSIDFVVIA